MPKFRDMDNLRQELLGKVFYRLTIIDLIDKKGSALRAICQCVCGNQKEIFVDSLKKSNTKSCGCFQSEEQSKRSSSHKLSKTRTYTIWAGMKNRCYNKSCTHFDRYGGRGITVCIRWLDLFENFFADMGECPENYTLDRINNDGNYILSNCRWVSRKDQARNRSTNMIVDFKDQRITLAELAETTGISKDILWLRIVKNKLSVQEAVNDLIITNDSKNSIFIINSQQIITLKLAATKLDITVPALRTLMDRKGIQRISIARQGNLMGINLIDLDYIKTTRKPHYNFSKKKE